MSTLTILEYIGGVAGAVAAAYGVIRFIDSRIEKKMGDESVIKKIASRVRPAVIFDENDSILVDQGGMEFLESIHVTHDENDRTPSEIAVVPKKHLPHAPLIEPIDTESIVFEWRRTEGFSWAVSLDYLMYHEGLEGKRRFRLELVT